jgi:hypothetical protein
MRQNRAQSGGRVTLTFREMRERNIPVTPLDPFFDYWKAVKAGDLDKLKQVLDAGWGVTERYSVCPIPMLSSSH